MPDHDHDEATCEDCGRPMSSMAVLVEADGLIRIAVGPMSVEDLDMLARMITSDKFKEAVAHQVADFLEELKARDAAAKAKLN